jgi:hypothetical protein
VEEMELNDALSVNFSKHALQRAKERFKMNPKEAMPYFQSVLKEAKYIGVIEDSENHRSGQLFAYKRIAIHLSMDYKTVLTVYKADTLTYDPLKDKILELHKKKFNHYSIKERALQKRLDQLKLESQVEIAQCKLRKYKSRSEAVKMACDARIKAIEQTIQEYIHDIENLQTEKRRVARSMISVM